MGIIILVGMLFGAFLGGRYLVGNQGMFQELVNDSLFFKKEVGFFELFLQAWFKEIKPLLLISVFGLTAIGIVPIPVICAYKGFSIGFVGVFLISQYKVAGFFSNALMLAPTAIFSLPAYAFFSVFAFTMSAELFGFTFNNITGQPIKRKLADYGVKLLLSIGVLTVAALVETICIFLFRGILG
jgi:uncharacterized membrane protein SpoIIM required for sporulation